MVETLLQGFNFTFEIFNLEFVGRVLGTFSSQLIDSLLEFNETLLESSKIIFVLLNEGLLFLFLLFNSKVEGLDLVVQELELAFQIRDGSKSGLEISDLIDQIFNLTVTFVKLHTEGLDFVFETFSISPFTFTTLEIFKQNELFL